MPQRRLTVQDETGRKVTFDWHGEKDPTDADMAEVFAEAKAGDDKKAGEAINLSRVLGRENSANFKLPAQQYKNPAPTPTRDRNTVAGFEEDLNALLESKGVQASPEARQMRRNMMEGAMGGGMSTAAPTALGVKAAEFAPRLTGALQGGAERLYGGLLKAKDAVTTNFPTVVQDLIAAGAPITQGGRSTMVNLMKKAGAAKNALLDAADQRVMIPRETVRQGLDTSLDTALAQSPRPVKDLTKLAQIERELIPDNPGILPSHADRIKTTLQTEAKSGYTGRKLGQKVTDTVADAKMNMAGKLKDALEVIEPKLKDVNQSYAAAKGGAQALRDAVKRTSKHNVISLSNLLGGLLGTGVGGPGVGTAAGIAAVNALNNPNVGSRIAIGVDRLGRIPHLDQATKAALLKLLSEAHAPEDQNQGQ